MEMVGTREVRSPFRPSTADKDINSAMQLLSTAIREFIHKNTHSKRIIESKTFHQLVDLILSYWATFFPLPKSSKYKKTFQRALGIQSQLAHLDEESFDIDRHQHDLETLARIALSIKRNDVEEEIRKRLPFQPQPVTAKSTNGAKVKELWVQLKDEGKHLFEDKQWALALARFSEAIGLNHEECILYSDRALCEIQLLKFQLAKEDAEDAIELNPSSAEYKRILSRASMGLHPLYQGKSVQATTTDFYNLGLSYYNGKGELVQDLLKAETYFKMAANAGHKEAAFMIGKLLLEKEKPQDAYPVIQDAAEHGIAKAQYELGRMLMYGDGCSRNEVMAKKWLTKAQNQGFMPESEDSTQWITEMIQNATSLLSFESENNLITTGMTMSQRRERHESHNCFNFTGIGDILEWAVRFETRLPAKQLNFGLKPSINKWMPLMMKKAHNGSFKAQSFFNAHRLILQAKASLQENKTVESFRILREARRLWDCPIIDLSIFVKAAEDMVNKKIADAEAYHLLACWNNSSPTKSRLDMAIRSVELDPSVPDFHYELGRIYGFMQFYQRGLDSIDRALQLHVHTDWLYDRASLLRSSKQRADYQVIAAYDKYLDLSPPDGRFVPEANYCISLAYHAMSNSKKTDYYLRKGQKAETRDVRLPCFESVSKGDCDARDVLEGLFKVHRHKPRDDKKSRKGKIFEIFCAVCSNCNPSKFCVYCHKWVCGLDEYDKTGGLHVCQTSHIAQHKSLVVVVPPPS